MLSSPRKVPHVEEPYDADRNISDISTCANGGYELPPEECWLYKIPNRIPSEQPVVPIVKWLRDVFELPESPFSQSRRNLLTRLEVILANGGPTAAYRFGGSVPSLNLNGSQQSSFCEQNSSLDGNTAVFPRTGMPSMGSSDSLSAVANGSLVYNPMFGVPPGDALTFNRVRLHKYSLPPQRSGSQRSVTTPSTSTSHLSRSLGGQNTRGWSGSTGKIGSCDTLETTKTNVQEIARIQEDILKADVAALVAAAACRHGSQHSLGSYGRRSLDGSLTQLNSAPGSPNASVTQLPQADNTTYINNSSRDTHQSGDALSLNGITSANIGTNYARSQTQYSHEHPDYQQYGYNVRLNSSNSGPKLPYSILPQRPTLPAGSMYQSPDVSELPVASSNLSYTCQPDAHSVISTEPRTHFGFRPSRKTSVPVFSGRPPLPSECRRVSTPHTTH